MALAGSSLVKVTHRILGLAFLMMAELASAQLNVGENTKLNVGGLFTFGYAGDYGNAFPSSHGLDFGFDGKISGSYYNPNFLSFEATPYWNQSRADSDYQSLTGARGITGTANLFTGSHFPGAISYHYDDNSTGTLGLTGQPNFTTHGKGQGIGINWSALVPDWPTLTVGFTEGSGHGTIYGTDQQSDSSTRLFNVHSTYQLEGFNLTGFFDRNSLNSTFPEFLAGEGESVQDSNGHDFGFGAQHALPIHGIFSVNYNRATASSDYSSSVGNNANTSSYTDNTETANANFHPTQKLSLNLTQNYTDNLTGYLTQNLVGTGTVVPGLNLGTGSHSSTVGGGATYQFTNYLSAQGQATYYDQYYFGTSYTGTYVSGTLNYGKRLFDMFTFSGSVVDSDNGQGNNAVGFVGTVNYFHRIGGWQTSGAFSYAQNVQTLLVTYTTSYYNYNANLHRRLPGGATWTAAVNGSHSGLTNYSGTDSSSQGYSTAVTMRKFTLMGNYVKSSGISLLGSSGIIGPPPTPGLNNFIFFGGTSYGGGFSVTPMRRLVIAGAFSRAISDTIGSTTSHNNTEIFNAQLQYHLRRIGLQAGYTQFSQGISAVGAPASTSSFFVGMTRWFDFF